MVDSDKIGIGLTDFHLLVSHAGLALISVYGIVNIMVIVNHSCNPVVSGSFAVGITEIHISDNFRDVFIGHRKSARGFFSCGTDRCRIHRDGSHGGWAAAFFIKHDVTKGNVAAVLYSNPNNPAWICLTEEELQIIGELATKYDVIVLEDMAYLCMDFRKDMSVPFEPPFQSTVARYTDNYVMLLSASKIFSYAGERIGMVCIGDKLYRREYPALKEKWGIASFGDNFILNYLYINTSGAAHTAQYAFSAMLEASVDGRYNFVKELREYGQRAYLSREIFERNGFHLVYDRDMEQTIGDGFFYTVGYKRMQNRELLEALFRCGVVAIPLNTTGSGQCGIRVCVSRLLSEADFQRLEEHLKLFVNLVNS